MIWGKKERTDSSLYDYPIIIILNINCDLQQQNDKHAKSSYLVGMLMWNATNAIEYNFNVLRMINGAYIKMYQYQYMHVNFYKFLYVK